MNEGQSLPEKAFPSTHWSQVAAAGAADIEIRNRALGQLLQRYRGPLLKHLKYRFRLTREDAEDHLHSFIEQKVMEQGILKRSNRERGKFRTFLLQSLDNYVRDAMRWANRRKRKATTVPLDEALALEEPRPAAGAVDPFDVEWARTVVAEAVRRMKEECRRKARADIWTMLRARKLRPVREGCKPTPYEELVRQLQLKSPMAAQNLLTTAERMFRRNLETVVCEYVEGPDEMQSELKALRAILANAS